jgi:hypothetical protein
MVTITYNHRSVRTRGTLKMSRMRTKNWRRKERTGIRDGEGEMVRRKGERR